MARKIQFKRGPKSRLGKLSPAEMAFTDDEKKLYVGDGSENIRLLDQKDKTEITTQLAEKELNLESVTKNPSNYTGAVVTFIDDDCDPLFKTIWPSILDTQGINITLACITGRVGQSSSLTLKELKDLQSAGNDVVSHTVNHYSTKGSSNSVLETEFKDSKKWLQDNGFDGHDVLVYPGGIDPPASYVHIKDIARKYYKYAVATLGSYNNIPVDNWAMNRPNIDTSTLDQLKAHVDNAVANNGWLVFLSHSHELAKDKENNIAKLNALIDYIQSLNMPILPFKKAEKLKGNAIAIGEYTKEKSMFVSSDGISKTSGNIIIPTTQTANMDASINIYQKNTKTIQVLNKPSDTYLNTGGVMEVFRSSDDVYSYATFKPFSSNKLYTRRWNFSTNVWYPWEIIGAFDSGTWTPTLIGSTTPGAHTYYVQEGSFTKFANMVTVRFNITIQSANFDPTMAGNVRIGGLPLPCLSGMKGKVRNFLEMSKINIGTNYHYPFIGIQSGQNYIEVYKGGNAVSSNYLNVTEIDKTGTYVVLAGDLTYQII